MSAKKIDGVRAYELARKQVAVELPPVAVQIYQLELLDVRGSEAHVRVHCSGGTYLRSIAHELGKLMGGGAHVRDLRRTASGDFDAAQARTIEELERMSAEGRLQEALIPAAKLLPEFPAVFADTESISHIRQGRNFPVSPFRVQTGTKYVRAVSREGELIAIGEAVLPNLYHPLVVI